MTTSHRRQLRADVLTPPALALYAAAATVEDVDTGRRQITGRVVPYGVPGRTHLGPLSIRAGAVRFREPDRRVIGVYGHTGIPGEPPPSWPMGAAVARMVEYEDGADALRMRFRVPQTPLGDTLLAEADPEVGVRSSLSIELTDLELDPWSGDVVAGLCEFVAFVPLGAYDDAQVTSVAASVYRYTSQGDDVRRRLYRPPFGREFITVGGGGQPAPQQQAPQQPANQQQAPAQQLQAPQQQAPAQQLQAQQQAPAIDWQQLANLAAAAGMLQQQAPAQPQQAAPPAAPQLQAAPAPVPGQPIPAAAPGGLPGGAVPRNSGGQALGQSALWRMAELQAQVIRQGGMTLQLQAALADITNSGLDLFQGPAGAIGEELWSGEGDYQRRYTVLMRQKPLTSWKGTGWQWVTRPVVGAYAGDKVQIPTNTVSVEPKEWEAQRFAGGWDIDRKFKDFGDAAFWAGFYQAQTDSYREQTDDGAITAIVAAARLITTDANVPTEYQGVNVAQADIFKGVALGNAILEDTKNVKRSAQYVMMNSADWLQLLNYTNLDLPAFLALLGVKPESFMRTPDVPVGHLIMGVTPAMTFRELGGGSPIRVEALDVARAGVDSAVYGYAAYSLDRPGGVIDVPLVVPGG